MRGGKARAKECEEFMRVAGVEAVGGSVEGYRFTTAETKFLTADGVDGRG